MQAKNPVKLQNFARRLSDLAEQKGLRQIDIVRALAAKPGQVGNWFQGRNGPGKRAEALAKLLGTTVDWLVEGRHSHNSRYTENQADEPTIPLPEPSFSNAPSLDEYLEFLRGCRTEAERLGAGDPTRAAALFDKMLGTWSETVSQHKEADPMEHPSVRAAVETGRRRGFEKAAKLGLSDPEAAAEGEKIG